MAHSYYHYAAGNQQTAYRRQQSSAPDQTVLWKCLLLIGLTYLVWSEKMSIVFDLSPAPILEQLDTGEGQNVKASLFSSPANTTPKREAAHKPEAQVALPTNTKGHAKFSIDPGFAERNEIEANAVSASMAQCKDYIDRFAPVAVAEMRKFGIPASIILAQGLLESNAGDSKLAQTTNNHFGIKCFSKRCKRGHCTNFSDDSHKDFFVRYSNIWSSYRAHSNFLKNSSRYADLFQLRPNDYKAWAKGLAKSGYATDKKYAEKLIALIQNLNLHKYDQP